MREENLFTHRVAASNSAADVLASKDNRMRAFSATLEATVRLPVLLFLGRCRGKAS